VDFILQQRITKCIRVDALSKLPSTVEHFCWACTGLLPPNAYCSVQWGWSALGDRVAFVQQEDLPAQNSQ